MGHLLGRFVFSQETLLFYFNPGLFHIINRPGNPAISNQSQKTDEIFGPNPTTFQNSQNSGKFAKIRKIQEFLIFRLF